MNDFKKMIKMLDDAKNGRWKRDKMLKQTKVNGFLISTVLPADTEGRYETMIFQCNKSGKVTDWSSLDVIHYDTEEQAIEDHSERVKEWENKI